MLVKEYRVVEGPKMEDILASLAAKNHRKPVTFIVQIAEVGIKKLALHVSITDINNNKSKDGCWVIQGIAVQGHKGIVRGLIWFSDKGKGALLNLVR